MVVIDVEHGVLQAGNRHGCGNEENDTDEVSMDEGCLGTPGRPLFCEKIQKETPIGCVLVGVSFCYSWVSFILQKK